MTNKTMIRSQALCFGFLALLFLSACSIAPYRYDPHAASPVVERAVSQEKMDLRISASVPGKAETEAIFGIPMYDRGIQPVWIEIENGTEQRLRFMPVSVDDDYFTPHEVAYMYRKGYSKEARSQMEGRFHEIGMTRSIQAGETVSGYVFTHAAPGTKAFNVDVISADVKQPYHFTFFIDVPGFVPDHAEVDFHNLYTDKEIRETDVAGLRSLLREFDCCATDRSGQRSGLPINVVFVSTGLDLLQALLRAGWVETSSQRDEDYLSRAQHVRGRPPDATFRKMRKSGKDRNQLNLWLAPITVDGEPVWIGQIRQAIGKRTQLEQLSEFLLGTRLDPDMDDSRNFLLQNLWYSQSLRQFAWSDTGREVPIEDTKTDFNGDEYFTDGLRIVMWISGDVVSLTESTRLDWSPGRLR